MMIMWTVLLLGCGGDKLQCSESNPCEGFGESCIEGTCVAHGCATSAQCAMEQHCEQRTCVDGCGGDGDCFPGDVCQDGGCIAGGCRDTNLDCDFKEFCDPATGDCYEANGYYCRECQSDEDCGGNGNICLNFGLGRTFCGVECGAQSDCPGGFTCVPITDNNGNIVTNQCITYCWLFADRAAQPPPLATPVGASR